MSTKLEKKLNIEVLSCPRCGKRHPSVIFNKFRKHSDKRTHWAMCPSTQEPMMLSRVLDSLTTGNGVRAENKRFEKLKGAENGAR